MVIFQAGLQAKAVIFDFDGVIVDTEPLHYKAFQQILKPLGLDFSWDEYVKTFMGFDDRDAFIEAFARKARPIDSNTLKRLIDTKADIFQEVIRDGVSAYPGVVELVRSLREADIPLAICSGAVRSDILPILEMLEIKEYFELIVTADEVSKSKPDPESYTLALSKLSALKTQLHLTPTTTIAIEDTPAGIISAAKSGLSVVAVTNSYPREQLSDAVTIVDSLVQLLGFELA